MKTQDAPARHWTDRLPDPWRALAQLSRLDRPIGWRLLFLPCLMGVAVVRIEDGFWLSDMGLAGLFLIGAIAMRGAGCAYNDIVDRKIDAQVARTAARPIPAGRVSVRLAVLWLMAQCAVGLLVLLALPPLAQIVALAAIPLVAAYPFMKRITWWPQAWLGLTFSWGALVGGAAADTAVLLPEVWLVYAACIAWTIAYDTIYALQDREDDALIGVRSTARLFGARWRAWTLGFYVAAVFLWGLAAATAGGGLAPILALGLIGGLLVWPLLERAAKETPADALAAFQANAVVGLAVAAALALEPAWRMVRSIFLTPQ